MYNVEDDYFDNCNYNDTRKKKNSNKKIIIVLLIIIVLVISFYFYKKNYRNSYAYLEDELERSASLYIKNSNINKSNEYYIESSKLGVNLKSDCSLLSGVFVNNGKVQAYLLCDTYESKIISNSNKYISLNGKSISFLNKSFDYVDSLYELNDDVSVNINGIVGKDEGVYRLTYNVLKNNKIVDRLERKVVVLNNDLINDLYPKISLVGDQIEYLKINDSYQEKGVLASDKIDGVINNVKIDGKVDTSKDGEYNITYSVTNSRGYSISITRKVIVIKEDTLINVGFITIPNSLTNGKVKIIGNIYGEDFDYVLLPNQEKIYQNDFTYEVLENGTYLFKIYDKNGNVLEKSVVVNNIDKSVPKGSCEAIIYNQKTNISINAHDEQGILGYNYIIDGMESGYISNNTYTFNMKGKSVSVKVKDQTSNETIINCSVLDKSLNDMTIKPVASVSFPCNTDVSRYNQELMTKVNDSGLKSRDAVATAGNYLASELGYRIEYWWAGKYDKVGINPEWGCQKEIWDDKGWGKYTKGSKHPFGLDCTGFVKWAFINAGFAADLIPRADMSYYFGTVKPITVSFSDNSPLINNLKAGDILYAPGHVALVIAVDDNQIKIAQAVGKGVKLDLINKQTGKAISDSGDFTKYILLDEFYQKYGTN